MERLIKIKAAKKIIFVGDTHGDIKASQKVIKNYLAPENKIVFLGDYVDRGLFSKENLDFLLEQREKYPEQIFLLQGNHEGHRILQFQPADFWENLPKNEYKKYCDIVEKFPLVVETKDIIALHGALPNVENLEKINEIKLGSENWRIICWGDFLDKPGEYLGVHPFSGRPQFGRDYFFRLMGRFKKKILIRSHQPDCPQFIFSHKCVTIFTSSVYGRKRTIAILDFKKKIKNGKDLKIVEI